MPSVLSGSSLSRSLSARPPSPVPSKHSKHCTFINTFGSYPNLSLWEMLVTPFDRCGNWGSKKSRSFREQLELRHTQSGFGALVSVLSSTDWRATPCIRTTKDRGWSGQGKEGFESYPELELRICKAKRKRTPFVNSQEIARHNERSRRTGRGRKRQRRHLCPTKPGPEPELRDWVSTFLMNRTGYPRLLRHHHLH